jgi:hypothetical protein
MSRDAPFSFIASIIFSRQRRPRTIKAIALTVMPFALCVTSKRFEPFAAIISPESKSFSI